MNNPLLIKMEPGLYQVSWQDDGTCTVEKILNTNGRMLVTNRYVRSGAVTLLEEIYDSETSYVLFVVEEAPKDVHISRESTIADLIDTMREMREGCCNEERRIETLNDLKKAFSAYVDPTAKAVVD
jgi:hypothetical protein